MGGGRAVTGNHGLYVNGLSILAPDLSGGIDGFDGPVRPGFGDYGMGDELNVGRQRHVGEIGGEAGALHVAEEMKFDGSMDRLCHGADGASEFAEVAVTVAGLNGLHCGAELRLIGNGLGHETKLGAECRDLGSRRAFTRKDSHGGGLGISEASFGPHAEGVVDYEEHEAVTGEGGGVAIDERVGEGRGSGTEST